MIPRTWLSRIAVVVIALGSALTLVAHDADAKRFGGGKSFGRQSSNVSKSYNQPAPAAPSQAAPAPVQQPGGLATQPQRNRWLGPLAGIAAGIGLAALFSHFGMGGAMGEMLGSMLMIGLLVMAGLFIWRLLKRGQERPKDWRQEPAYQGAPTGGMDQNSSRFEPVTAQPSLPGGAANSVMASFNDAPTWGIPADFDKEGFARSAKVHFIRLQTAWDAKDLADIREFTTPEMYAEVKMQLSEMKGETSHTEVVDLDAEVLGVERGAQEELASVRFKGTLRESRDGPAEAFEEVWNLLKPASGRSGWLLAGIQQVR